MPNSSSDSAESTIPVHPHQSQLRQDGMKPPEWLTAALIVGMAFIFWRPDFAFFWRDEWEFLDSFRNFQGSMLFTPHYGHVIPLFKLFYLGELHVFGTNSIFFAYVNIVFFAMGNYALFRLARGITSATSAWILALVLTAHPIMFNHLGWSFEQCISLQLLFQAAAVGAFVRWSRGAGTMYWMLAFTATIIQAYIFGNGLFLPLLFVAGAFLLGPATERKHVASAFLLLFLAFTAVQLLFGGERSHMAASPEAIWGMVAGGTHLLAVNASRYVFIQEHALGRATPWLAIGFFLLCVVLALTNKKRDRRIAVFLLIWFAVTFCSIPIVIGNKLITLSPVPHYYSILSLAPVLFIAEHALAGRSLLPSLPRPILPALLAVLFSTVFLLDQQLKEITSFRSFRNQQLMMKSLQDGTPYYGLDDPYFSATRYRVKDPAGIYAYWRSKDRFHAAFGYANDPENWTREQTLVKEP